jgi:hypothetical protein
MARLKSLNDHNKERHDLFFMLTGSQPTPNGIACPNCGEELLDSYPMSILTVCPPQKLVHCEKCGLHSTRLV